jgi:polar amino acid transport system permease protein
VGPKIAVNGMQSYQIYFPAYTFYVLEGFVYNLLIASASFALGLVAAVALLVGSSFRLGTILARLYALVFRAVPPLVLLSIVYWVLPAFTGLKLDPLSASVVAFALRSTAFQAMILASAAASIDCRELEAAQALGLSRVQVSLYVLVPQALKRAIPALTNEFASLLKESSQSLAIGVMDSLARTRYVSIATGYNLVWIILVAALMYVASWLVIRAANALYGRFSIPGTVGFEVETWATSWRQ